MVETTTLRGLVREIKEFPATTTFCVLWIVVFAAMVATQFVAGIYPSWLKLLVTGIGDGHRFGDLTLNDLARHEYWRLITASFVHFSVLHLALNVAAMYQLGTMVESWYKPPQLIFIYGMTGGGGNLVSVLIRYLIGSSPRIHSGGGSVVIMGSVGLCAVAGLRSKTQMGVSLGKLMVGFMGLTALIGIALPQFIDNWGHAGGAVVGMTLGFAHHMFVAAIFRPSAWGRGVLTGILIAACGVAQVMADRQEAPVRLEQSLLRHLAALETNYQVLAQTELLVRRRADSKIILKKLDSLTSTPSGDYLPRAEFRGLRALAEAATVHSLSEEESHEFQERLTGLLAQTRRAYTAERKKLWQVRDVLRDQRSR